MRGRWLAGMFDSNVRLLATLEESLGILPIDSMTEDTRESVEPLLKLRKSKYLVFRNRQSHHR